MQNDHLDYFQFAVSLARKQASEAMAKRKQQTCKCSAYPFPHRAGSKSCAELAAENKGPEECYHCAGTGEGSHDGARCWSCRGSGVMKSKQGGM